MTILVGGLLAGLASALVVHELGHVVAAALTGGRVLGVHWRWLSAQVDADLPTPRAQVAFLLAGAGANVVVALAALALAFAVGSRTMSVVMGLAAGMHLLHALFALVPSGTSDGARLRQVLRAQRDGRSAPRSQGER